MEIDVLSQDDLTGNLVKIHPRKNQLIRPLATKVDQALVLFAIHEPEPDFHLLDRFVIMMEQQEIPVILCFNKMDLAREGEQEQITQDYRNSGGKVVFESTKTQEGIEELKQMLIGKTTVMAGPSGVGNSSALNCLGADKTMETGKVSQKI